MAATMWLLLLQVVWKGLPHSILFSLLPFLAEAAVCGVLFGMLLSMPWSLAALGGCIMAATSSTAVTQGFDELAREGYGTARGGRTVLG